MKFPNMVLCVALLAPVAAQAEDARKIDFSAPVAALDGKPYQNCVAASADGKSCLKSQLMTLGMMAAAALSIPSERGDAPVPLVDQVARGKLASRLIDAKFEALESKDITLIKEQIAKAGLPPVVVYHAVEMLDPAAVK